MSDKKVKRTGILPSDIDAAGNVSLWDHGPRELVPVAHETDDIKAARTQKRAAEIHEWRQANGDGPVAVVLYSSDAGHALMIDPDRYAIEPDDLDEGEIKKRMDEMREKREAALRAPQDAIDRRIAIAAMVSDRAQKKAIADTKAPERGIAYPLTPKTPVDHAAVGQKDLT